MTKYSESWLYDWLLRNNIELYEYQPSVLLAKIAVCDTAWATIGSYNINDISAYASIELNNDINDKIFVQALMNQLETLIQNDCIPITPEYHIKTKNVFK
jgi:cardiolipin synthase